MGLEYLSGSMAERARIFLYKPAFVGIIKHSIPLPDLVDIMLEDAGLLRLIERGASYRKSR